MFIVDSLCQGIKRRCIAVDRSNKRLPQLFTEDEEEASEGAGGDAVNANAKRFYPPASANETEYHIMKFYNFSAALVTNIMQEDNVKVCDLLH